MSDRALFETVLASTVHDMKNSLSLLLGEGFVLTFQERPGDCFVPPGKKAAWHEHQRSHRTRLY